MSWKLERFPEIFDRWVQVWSPSDDLRVIVFDWIFTRQDDPYQEMRREEQIPNLWFGPIPGTDEPPVVVTCSYYVYDRVKVVRAHDICPLNRPL